MKNNEKRKGISILVTGAAITVLREEVLEEAEWNTQEHLFIFYVA